MAMDPSYEAAAWGTDNSVWTPEAIQQALQALGVSPVQLDQNPPQPRSSWTGGVHIPGKGWAQKPPQVIPPGMQGMKGGVSQDWQKRQDDITRRQFELQAKRAEEAELREQHRAALAVRKAIQKMRLARPDTIDQLRMELEMAQAEQAMAMGPLAVKVQDEAEKALFEAQAKVAAETERQLEEERKQLEAEMQRREEEARAEAMSEEAAREVEEVESKVNHAEEMAMPLSTESSDESPEGLFEAASVTEEAINSAQIDLNLCSASIKERWSGMKSGVAGTSLLQKLGPHIRNLHARLTACRRTLVKLQETTKTIKERVGRKAAAMKKEREQKEAFDRADADGDGMLSREEMSVYVLGEYDMELSEEQLQKIFAKTPGSDRGINYSKLAQVHRIVGLMRSEIKERARREEEARRKAELEEAAAAHKLVTNEISALLQKATKASIQIKNMLTPLSNPKTAEKLDSDTVAAQAEEAMTPALERFEEAKSKLSEVEAEIDAEQQTETTKFKKNELGKLQKTASSLQGKFDELYAAIESARAKSARQSYIDLQRSHTRVVTAIRKLMAAEGQNVEQIFSRICGDAGASLEQTGFADFIESLQDVDVEVSQVVRLFEHIAEGASSISLDKFSEFTKLLYTVSKSTMLTDRETISSKAIRRLAIGEILESLDGPVIDERTGIQRMKFFSKSHEDEGWVTLMGNQGTVFLQPCSMFYYCVKKVALTDSLSDSEFIRTLDANEIIEAYGCEERDAKSNSFRVRCKVASDGSHGWATISAGGIRYFEPC